MAVILDNLGSYGFFVGVQRVRERIQCFGPNVSLHIVLVWLNCRAAESFLDAW
jgi:hypothetical protein